MRRAIWYHFVQFWVKVGFIFYFKKFEVVGFKNISKSKAYIFLPNHQNTFLDALTLVTTQRRMSHYMARADIFSSPRLIWLMSTINLRPIYRIRDGKEAINKNKKVFADLINFLGAKESVMIHPEGTHSLDYKLKPLKNGFIKLAYGYLKQFPDREIEVVPVGINYEAHTKFRSKVSIHYGKPIDARKYFEREDQITANQEFVGEVKVALEKLVIDIQPQDEYENKFKKLKAANSDFSNLKEVNTDLAKIENGEELEKRYRTHSRLVYKLYYPFAYVNYFLLIFLWKKLKPVFKDPAWHGSIKFCLGTFLGPIVLILQTLIVYQFVGPIWTFVYLYFCFASVNSLSIGQSNQEEWESSNS